MLMRDLVDLATAQPPPLRYTVDEIVEAGQRVQRRRRVGWATSGATAAVALSVAAVVTVPSLIGRASPPTAAIQRPGASTAQNFPAPAQPFEFTFDGYRVGKLQVARPIDASTAYQLASVYADGLITDDKAADPSQPQPTEQPPTLYAYMTVYRTGAYDPAKLAGAHHVTVGGRPGLEVSTSDGIWAARRTLAWQYGTDAWAVINASSTEADYPSAEQLRGLAAGLQAAPPSEAKVPFTMSYVPSGYHLDEAGMHTMTGLNGIASARDGNYAGLLFSKPAQPTTGLTEPFGGVVGADPPGSFNVFVIPAANSNQTTSPGVTCFNGFCNRWVKDGSVNLQVASGGRLSAAEMSRILNGITIGNVHDDGTWTPVTAAIP